MRVLVTGAGGQVGAECVRELDGRAEVLARDRAALDLASAASIRESVRAARPDVIVNCAAYTAVDRAESEREARPLLPRGGRARLASDLLRIRV